MRLNTYILGIFLMLLTSTAFAQKQAEKDQEAVKKMLKEFSLQYSSLPTHKDKKKVLQYCSTDMTSMLVSSNIRGTINVTNGDYLGFSQFLEKVSQSENITIKYDIKSIERVFVSGRNGVVVMTVDYEIMKDGAAWTKGTESVTMNVIYREEAWKIIHFTTVAIEDEKLKGVCYCKFFEAKAGDYVVQTLIPEGKSYAEKMDNFDFEDAGKDKMITIGDKLFMWLNTGDVQLMDPQTYNKTKDLGVARTTKEAIMLIIKNELYPESCGAIKN